MTDSADVPSVSQEEADQIIKDGLHLVMYGERAPGGQETWAEFGQRAETYLRRRLCAERGHTPSEPTCPECPSAEGRSDAAPSGSVGPRG